MTGDVWAQLDILRKHVDQELRALSPGHMDIPLYDAVAYVLEGSGKRVRALMTLATARGLGAEAGDAMPAALSVEVFHNFTLVHDDIMDRSDSRRGRPTVHVRWDESIGILAGDFLLALSFDLLNRLSEGVSQRAIGRFHEMVSRLCEGQALDTEFESRLVVTLDEYLDMISRKTGALIEMSLILGGLVARVDDSAIAHLEAVGRNAGYAFQIQDDLLDLTAETAKWGKPVGGDFMSAKKSYLTVKALEREAADGTSWLTERMLAGGLDKSEITEARKRLESMGVLEEAGHEIRRFYDEARTALQPLASEHDLRELVAIIERLLDRNV
jgi:geranylgeranyl diphosphate synthase type II